VSQLRKRLHKIFDLSITEGNLKSTTNRTSADEATTRWHDRINQLPEITSPTHFTGKFFQFSPVEPGRPKPTDIGTHTGTGNGIDTDTMLLQNLNHPNVS